MPRLVNRDSIIKNASCSYQTGSISFNNKFISQEQAFTIPIKAITKGIQKNSIGFFIIILFRALKNPAGCFLLSNTKVYYKYSLLQSLIKFRAINFKHIHYFRHILTAFCEWLLQVWENKPGRSTTGKDHSQYYRLLRGVFFAENFSRFAW